MSTVSSVEVDTLLDALERLQGTGPEFDGFLANHGPMAAEALTRIGGAAVVPRWVDHYLPRLDAAPEVIKGIGDHDWPRAPGPGALVRGLDGVPAAPGGRDRLAHPAPPLVAAAAARAGGQRHPRRDPYGPRGPVPPGRR